MCYCIIVVRFDIIYLNVWESLYELNIIIHIWVVWCIWFNYAFQLYYTDHVWLWNINYDVLMILDKEQITKNIWNEPKNVYNINTCVVIYRLSGKKKRYIVGILILYNIYIYN